MVFLGFFRDISKFCLDIPFEIGEGQQVRTLGCQYITRVWVFCLFYSGSSVAVLWVKRLQEIASVLVVIVFLCLQSLALVRRQSSSSAEIESILDSDQRDLIGDFSKVIQVTSSFLVHECF